MTMPHCIVLYCSWQVKLMSCQYNQPKEQQNSLICHERIKRSPVQISGKDTTPRETSSSPSKRKPSDLELNF